VKTVALTGNAASGKSTVADLWQQAGVPVVRSDELAREAVAPGSEGLAQVVARFGARVLTPEGTLDRDAMRARIVIDTAERRALEAIVHPIVDRLRLDWLAATEASGAPMAVVEIPLLYEIEAEAGFDEVVVVHAPEAERLRRLTADRGLAEAEGRALMATQMSSEEKCRRADHVIANGGSRAQLAAAAERTLAELRVPTTGAPGSSALADGWMRLDLHMHTWGSWDCLSDPERVLAQARRRGIGRIAITDHNRLHVALRMAEKYPEQVIPGEEVKTAEGIDVIGLYLKHEIPKATPAREVIDEVARQGGVSYLPHPFAGGKGGGGRWAEELAPLCDVVEVFNARLHAPAQNAAALELARRHARLPGVGSDAHTVGEVARVYLEVPVHENTPEGLRRALTRARPFGRSSSHLVHLASTWAKVRKKLPGCPGE
jgi:dephospho-CoA kinase